MNNKKKLIIVSISILVMLVSGFVFSKYKTNKKGISTGTRIVQSDDEDSKTEEKKQEEKKKAEEKKKEEKKEKSKDKKSDVNDKKQAKSTSSSSSSSNSVKKKGDTRTVHIRVEGYNKTFIPRTKVTTGLFDLNPYLGSATGSSATASKGWGVDKFKQPTNAHALVKALESKGFRKGSGYDLQDYGWGLYIAMIGGNREFDYRSTSGWMYRVNNVLPNVGCQGRPIKNGDEVLWYFGAYGFDTLVTEIKVSSSSVKRGQPITVTLNGIKNDINTWKEYREPAKGATIYANGKALNAVTDGNGKAVIKFSSQGTYNLSAERCNSKKIKNLVRPQPVIVNVK